MTQPNDPNHPPNYDPNFNPNFIPTYGPYGHYGPQYPFPPQPVGRPMTWQEVWTSAVTQASERTYWNIIADPQATTERAMLWIASATLIAGFLSAIANALISPINNSVIGGNAFSGQPNFFMSGETRLLVSILLIPVQIMAAIVGFAIIVGILHLIARVLGGKGDFDKMFYAFAAFYAPMAIIGGVIGLVPVLGLCVVFLLTLYQLYLTIVATKSVHQFRWGEAVITVFLPIITLFGCFFCFFSALFAS